MREEARVLTARTFIVTGDDIRPAPGQDGMALERLRSNPPETRDIAEFTEAMEKASRDDANVEFEVMELYEALEAWILRKALEARSKPSRDTLYELQDWIDRRREDQ